MFRSIEIGEIYEDFEESKCGKLPKVRIVLAVFDPLRLTQFIFFADEDGRVNYEII
tara:strand:+ start:20037 stop:20204 length:168 start_codon:yes stop_codon:yes gene_type:complete